MAIRAWKASLAYRVRRVLGAVPGVSLHRYVLVAVPVEAMPARMPDGFTVIRPTRDELVAAGLAERHAAAWRETQGMVCVGIARGTTLVGATWLGIEDFYEDEVHVTFAPPAGAAWDTGMVVLPAMRGGRAFAALWAATRAWAQAQGVRWSMSRIADYNLGSRRAHARLGAVEVGRVTVFRVGGRQWVGGARPFVSDLGGTPPMVRVRVPGD